MNTALRKTTMGVAAVATAGASTLIFGAAPATAAASCGVGTMIEPNVCELVFTADGQLIPTADMTKLEVLLVGAGGSALTVPAETTGYAAAGGGGEVKVVGFPAVTGAAITVTVPTAGVPGSVTDGTTLIDVANGLDAAPSGTIETTLGTSGGTSGTGNAGAFTTTTSTPVGGGGASAAAVGTNGGAGTVVSSVAAVDSLFATDSNCYGGGGAAGLSEQQGLPTCGGGGPTDATAADVFAPTPNSGGGGGSVGLATDADNVGADGLVVFRWVAVDLLPATGGGINPLVISAGLAALFAGAALAVAAGRRRRATDVG